MAQFWADGFWAEGFWEDGFWEEGAGDPGPPSAAARMLRVRRFGSIKWSFLLMATTALTHV